jgi:hypothetical protein
LGYWAHLQLIQAEIRIEDKLFRQSVIDNVDNIIDNQAGLSNAGRHEAFVVWTGRRNGQFLILAELQRS